VNGAHNDATVALGLLGIVLLLKRGRVRPAGWLLGAVVLVKISIGFAVLPLAVWTATRYGRRGLLEFAGRAALLAGPVMLVIPGALHSVTNANGGVVTRMAIWNIPMRVSWIGLSHQPGVNFATVGMVAALGLGGFGAWLGRYEPDPGRGAAIGAGAWLVATGYVLAWYTVLGFLVAALRPNDRLTRWIALQGGLITAAFLIPRGDLDRFPVVGHVVMFYVPLTLAIGFGWAMIPLVTQYRRRGVTPDRTSPIATE